jgi:hypothetical protein
MGIFYKACNHELDEAAELCRTAPAGQLVQVPWLKGMALTDDGRLAVLASYRSGVGLAKRGDNYKFYVSRRFAGCWGFEAWGAIFSASLASYLLTIGLFSMEEALRRGPLFNELAAGRGLWGGMIVGVLGILLFGMRGLGIFKYPKISLMSGGRIGMHAACINFTALVLSIALIKHAWPQVQAHGFYGVSLMDALSYGVPRITYHAFDAAFKEPLWVILAVVPAALAANVLFAAGLAWVLNQVCFIHISYGAISDQIIKQFHGEHVVADMLNGSEILRVVNNKQGVGTVLCGALYLLVLVGAMFFTKH